MIVIDLETTGLDPETDRIVELSYVIDDGPTMTFRCNPGMPIPPSATEVNGITDTMVAGCPPFSLHAPAIAAIMQREQVVVAHSPFTLDIPLLKREFLLAGIDFDWSRMTVLDTRKLYAHAEPRSLSAIYQRLFHEPLKGAHGSAVDAMATWAIYREMLLRYPELRNKSVAELEAISRQR